jgi:hypothetical protein
MKRLRGWLTFLDKNTPFLLGVAILLLCAGMLIRIVVFLTKGY